MPDRPLFRTTLPAAIPLLTATTALAQVGLYTEFQGSSPFVQTGTTEVVINETNYARVTPSTIRLEVRPRTGTAGVNCATIGRVTDLYTLNGPPGTPPGTAIPVTVTFDVHYTISPFGNYSMQANSQLGTPAGLVQNSYSELFNGAFSSNGNPNMDLTSTFNWTVGQPVQIQWRLAFGAQVNVHVNAGNTGTLAFTLPPGYSVTSQLGWTDPNAPQCGPADYNGDGDVGTDQDIEAFFACLGGTCCATCYEGGADFNGDGDIGTDQDIESFFRVLGGGAC